MSVRPQLRPLAAAVAMMVAASFAAAATAPMQPAFAASGSARATRASAADFGAWAGSEANAASLVDGLCNKTPVTLIAPGGNTPAGRAGAAGRVSFTSSTGPMSRRNAQMALALARAQLTVLGLAQPTPTQIAAALVGGSVTVKHGKASRSEQLIGVLNMRASGMEWERIATILGIAIDPRYSAPDATAAATLPAASETERHGAVSAAPSASRLN